MFSTDQPSYTALRHIVAERTNSLVAWVGSGLGVPAGLPTWPLLRQRLVKALEAKARPLDPPQRVTLTRLAQDAAQAGDSWTAFSILKDGLGDTLYRSAVKEALAPSARQRIPPLYSSIWLLRPSGILNLNLDRFASRAYAVVDQGSSLHEFSGRDAANYIHLLQSTSPLVANLHGILDDHSTWVFTRSELSALFRDPGYQLLIQTILASRTVIFVGITADDIAAGGHLSSLTKMGISLGDHFWITTRRDEQTVGWADEAGLRLIHYSAPDSDHAELKEAIHDLNKSPQ